MNVVPCHLAPAAENETIFIKQAAHFNFDKINKFSERSPAQCSFISYENFYISLIILRSSV